MGELPAGLSAAVADRTAPAPALRGALTELDDPATARSAGRILAGLPPETADLRPVRVTVLATGTIGPFEHLLRASLVAVGTHPTLELGDYGAFELSLAGGDLR